MPLKVPNVGLQVLCPLLTSQLAGAQVGVYVNDYTPAAGTQLTDLVEATFPGYSRQNLTGWSAVAIVSDHAKQDASECVFQLSSSGGPYSCYGIFVVDSGGNLLWVERDPNAPGILQFAGQIYSVFPQFSMVSEF